MRLARKVRGRRKKILTYPEVGRPSAVRTALLGLLLVLCAGGPVLAQLPSGYQVLRQFGKPCRLDPASLPWRIGTSDPRMEPIVTHALQTWNAEGLRLGVGPFFAAPLPDRPVDLVIDWSGRGLPPDKAGGVYWDAGLGYRRVTRLVMDGKHRVPDGNRAQILLQELGHVLGLSHSEDRGDVMFTVMQTRRLRSVSSARLTARDRAALEWLYAQPEWVPIVGPSQPLKKTRPTPEPGFTPVPQVEPDPVRLPLLTP